MKHRKAFTDSDNSGSNASRASRCPAKVRPITLLAIAGMVWCIAGANIASIGAQSALQLFSWQMALGALLVFLIFYLGIFKPLVTKHAQRITAHTDRLGFWRFFDAKGYVTMACMMSVGFGLRASGIAPGWFIAFFYTGLGLALAAAGLAFEARYLAARKGTRAS